MLSSAAVAHFLGYIREKCVCQLVSDGEPNAFSGLSWIELDAQTRVRRHNLRVRDVRVGFNRNIQEIGNRSGVKWGASPTCISRSKDQVPSFPFNDCDRVLSFS
jgi:hypothetical protein